MGENINSIKNEIMRDIIYEKLCIVRNMLGDRNYYIYLSKLGSCYEYDDIMKFSELNIKLDMLMLIDSRLNELGEDLVTEELKLEGCTGKVEDRVAENGYDLSEGIGFDDKEVVKEDVVEGISEDDLKEIGIVFDKIDNISVEDNGNVKDISGFELEFEDDIENEYYIEDCEERELDTEREKITDEKSFEIARNIQRVYSGIDLDKSMKKIKLEEITLNNVFLDGSRRGSKTQNLFNKVLEFRNRLLEEIKNGFY